MKSLKAKFRKTDSHEWSKNDERLLSAVEHGEMEKVTSLLSKKGASATKLDSEGKSALHVAATRGQTECLAVILAHGGDVSIADASGFSALHLAAKNNHQECARKLLQSKCVVDALDASGRTALHHAAINGNVVIVQLLCEHKCPVNLRDSDGLTALLLSARHCHTEACAALLDWGAEINACDKNGRTALMLAAESNCGAVVDLLVHRAADLNVVDSLGHDVLHYARASGNAEVCCVINSALQQQPEPDKTPSRTSQHDHVAKLNEDRSSTPKKRKAPPPPVSPLQSPGLSPPYVTPSETPLSSKNDPTKRFNCKEEDLVLKEEIERLQEEKVLLLETIEQLKQIVEQTEPKAQGGSADSTLVEALQAKVASLSLENQQLAQIIKVNKLKKRPAPQGEEGQQDSRPNSFESNASYHSTCADFDEEGPSAFGDRVKCQDEVLLLKDALQNVQAKLDESRLENRSLQARLGLDSDKLKQNGNEGLKAKAGDGHQKYEDVSGEGEDQLVQKFQYLKSCLEQEVKDLKARLAKSEEEKTHAASLIKELEARERLDLKNSYADLLENANREKVALSEKYEEAQEEIRMLQDALRGTVSVEAAAKDFEDMKAEMGGVIDGLQKRLMEMSKSFSETKSELSTVRGKLQALEAEDKTKSTTCLTKEEHEHKMNELSLKVKDVELKHQSALKEIARLKEEAETQAQSSVSLLDHTQVVASLGNAIKSLEAELEAHKQELAQKMVQMDALRAEKNATTGVSKQEHEKIKETLESEIRRLTQLLQDALRKQDELALEVTGAWQEVKDGRNEKEAAQKLALTKEQENNVLNGKCKEAQDGIAQLKKQIENHVNSEREKNKKIDDLSKEVGKLKDALNSLSQLSYATSNPKRQQNQQVESLQQQIKQLQYQLTEAKKRHHEIVSVYRMHLLYAVQGQMDEDVQKALKQILVMCKLPTEDK